MQRGNAAQIRKTGKAFERPLELTAHGLFAREFHDKELFYFVRESMELLHRYMARAIDQSEKKAARKKASSKR
jgi:hypothetical protein